MQFKVIMSEVCVYVCVFADYHRRFQACESTSFLRDSRIFGIHYGSGHVVGVIGRDTLKVYTLSYSL